MDPETLYVIVENKFINIPEKTILGIFTYNAGMRKIQLLQSLHSDKKYILKGPFKVQRDNLSSLSPSPFPNPFPNFPNIQPFPDFPVRKSPTNYKDPWDNIKL